MVYLFQIEIELHAQHKCGMYGSTAVPIIYKLQLETFLESILLNSCSNMRRKVLRIKLCPEIYGYHLIYFEIEISKKSQYLTAKIRGQNSNTTQKQLNITRIRPQKRPLVLDATCYINTYKRCKPYHGDTRGSA